MVEEIIVQGIFEKERLGLFKMQKLASKKNTTGKDVGEKKSRVSKRQGTPSEPQHPEWCCGIDRVPE